MLLAAVTPPPPSVAPSPPSTPFPVYRLVRRKNKEKREQRRQNIPPPPLDICPSSSSPFFHGEELSRCMLRRSRGCDGMELRQIGQGKVSLGGQSLGTHMLLCVLPCALTGSNNATGIALPAPLYSVRLHGAATWSPVTGTASRVVIRERGGVWGLSPKYMECYGR